MLFGLEWEIGQAKSIGQTFCQIARAKSEKGKK